MYLYDCETDSLQMNTARGLISLHLFQKKSKARAEIIQIYISQIFIDNFIYLTQTFMFYVFIFKHEFEIIATLLKINIHKKKYTIFDLFYIRIKLFSINLINKSSSISSSKYFIIDRINTQCVNIQSIYLRIYNLCLYTCCIRTQWMKWDVYGKEGRNLGQSRVRINLTP